jgi:acetyl-CoA carboxylase biotin carboxyl carrier protein
MRVKLVRQVTVAAMAMPVAAAPAPSAAAPAAAAAPAPAAPAAEIDADHPGAVNSPMVGVAYLSSEPTAAPFVTLGSKVAQGQTLLLIEAMKTYNQIKAPRAGTVTRILVESGTPVEFGEPLMIVE